MKKIFNDIKRVNPNLSKQTKIIYIIVILAALLMVVNNIYSNAEVLVIVPILIISVMLHELAHGFVAFINGDDTAKIRGRLSLNPIKHMDVYGTLLPAILILTGSTFVIGWAKPVPVNYYKLNNQKSAIFFISIAGIVMNLVLAVTGALLFKFLPNSLLSEKYIYLGLLYLIRLNISLAIFNLLPIPPLDGSKILTAFGSNSLKMAIYNFEKYGFLVIMLLLWTGILDFLMNPLYQIFYGIINFIIGA